MPHLHLAVRDGYVVTAGTLRSSRRFTTTADADNAAEQWRTMRLLPSARRASGGQWLSYITDMHGIPVLYSLDVHRSQDAATAAAQSAIDILQTRD